MNAPVWKVIPHLPAYEVSTDGKVRNAKSGRPIAVVPKGDGYMYVTLRENGRTANAKTINRSVHRLVAMTFLPNPDGKRTVNHKDKVRHNNHVDNLEWASHSEQSTHARSFQGPIKYEKDYKHPDSTPEDEQWAACTGTSLQVSNYGRIKGPQGLRKLSIDGRGYCFVTNNPSNNTSYVHRLVAEAFLGLDASSAMVVNHKDGNKSNNHVDNLEVITQSENIKHAYAKGLLKKTNHQEAIQVDYKGNIVNKFKSLADAEAGTSISRGCIHNSMHNGATSHGYRWFSDMQSYEESKASGDLLSNFFKVIQTDDKGTIVSVYDSYPDAFSATRVTKTNISRSCKTGYCAGGYKWFQCYADYLKMFPIT